MKFKDLARQAKTSCSPLCIHYEKCGGCQLQHITYAEQLKLKTQYLSKLFDREVPVIASQNHDGYRNRMDFIYTSQGLCLREQGKFNGFVPITDCMHLPDGIRDVFTAINTGLLQRQVTPYDINTHNGFLKYVVFRYSWATGQIMVIFTTASAEDGPQTKKLQDLLETIKTSCTSIYWFVNATITDISIPQAPPVLRLGAPTISDLIGDIELSYGPHSFFQTNTQMTKVMFDQIREYVFGETVDLCCGVGAITLFVADKATTITGIEQIPEAIDLAALNATKNGISTAHFFCNDIKKFLDHCSQEVNTLILDPPRTGIEKKTIERIALLAPERIIYMSCNPTTQKIDLDMLQRLVEYDIIFLQGYDMFAHTNHIETITVLDRRKSSGK